MKELLKLNVSYLLIVYKKSSINLFKKTHKDI